MGALDPATAAEQPVGLGRAMDIQSVIVGAGAILTDTMRAVMNVMKNRLGRISGFPWAAMAAHFFQRDHRWTQSAVLSTSGQHLERKAMGQLNAGIVPVTPFQQNCTILFDMDDKQGVVVDPGGDVDKILAVLKDNAITAKAIWVTHGHIDHAGGAMDLKDALSIDIIGPHEADRPLLANLENQAKRFGLTDPVRNCIPDRFLSEGDTVSFGEHSFEVLHCPGHAPGHVVYYNRAAKFAHVGDVLFRGSIGRTDLPGGDHAALITSIKDKLLPLGDDIGFICGHGPGGRFGEERRTNPFLA